MYGVIRRSNDVIYLRKLLGKICKKLEKFEKTIQYVYDSDWSDPRITNDTPEDHYYWYKIANAAIDGNMIMYEVFCDNMVEIPAIIKAYFLLAMDPNL